jgi:phosphomannomutase
MNIMPIPNFTKEHADQILAHINVEAIRARKFKVVVDMINASACVIDPYLFEQLGVELIPLNNVPNGKFAHKPEPLRENLGETMKTALDLKADVGFVHDPDADRLVLINERGEVILEEYTITLVAENILSKNPGKTFVTQLSTSRMSEKVAEKYGSKCIRTVVGEPPVVEGIIKNDAILGGEGNGGVIYPTINFARDSFVGLSLVLELLAERKKTVSELVALFPRYFMKKEKYSLEGKDLRNIIWKLKDCFKEAKSIEIDGVRLDFPDDSWLHLHPSNTEPIVRLFGEAKTAERIEALFNEAKLTSGL